jgi:hypothetical protein
MGFDLTSESGEKFQFSNSGWRHMMEFAKSHGFVWPAAEGEEDKGELTATEAAALASAIEQGIGDAPASEIAPVVSEHLTKLLVTPSRSDRFPIDPIRIKPRTIDYWRQFIRFARLGGFSVCF